MKKLTTPQKLWIGIGILALLSPLGIILPRLFNAGGAWGEWTEAELERIAGFLPEGMRRSSGLWKAPLPDYAVPGQNTNVAGESLGYLLAGIAGVVVTAAVAYAVMQALAGKRGAGKGDHKDHGKG